MLDDAYFHFLSVLTQSSSRDLKNAVEDAIRISFPVLALLEVSLSCSSYRLSFVIEQHSSHSLKLLLVGLADIGCCGPRSPIRCLCLRCSVIYNKNKNTRAIIPPVSRDKDVNKFLLRLRKLDQNSSCSFPQFLNWRL